MIYVKEAQQLPVLQQFISEVMTGERTHRDPAVRQFDMFSSILKDRLSWWPLCYISCILELFPSVIIDIPFFETMHEHLRVQATKVETGLDWELIVRSALLLRCIDAKVNGTRGPFDIVEPYAKPDVLCVTLPGECTTLDLARVKIATEMGKLRRVTVAIFTPAYSKFPDNDGFVAYRSLEGLVRVFGYQCKLNRANPKHDAALEWVEKAFLLRGNAPSEDNKKRNWEYCGKEFIIKLLGKSLEPLYPANWEPTKTTDEYD
jgi:hypothetical protein